MESVEDVQYLVVHGYRRAFRISGSGPALLLLHGLACDSSTWLDVIPTLSEHFTVIAPDLLGHGESDKPDADYSLGGYANGMRDLLTVLGIDKVTVVGHSFGGGVAMQFAYQFPDRTERVVLVSTGGLGKEVTPLIRFLTVPGSSAALAAATFRPWRPLVAAGMRALSRTPLTATRDLDEVARIYESLADRATRRAVQRVTSHVLNWKGQFVTMTDRSYLARLMPVLVVWGSDDMVIPAKHADFAPTQVSDVHVLNDAGHFPHKDHPEEFCNLVTAFIAANEPAHYHRGRWRALLRRGDQYALESVPAAVDQGVEPAIS
ncbi:alpha/beta fold hydrolase [Aeromicrobium ginsengisoli]|uniref:Alpha/beta fold hydrolase n=1 Tax=Aeromicrobium ginsengisoli TaxID=363867 RepID=A0A5M4FIP7_9ACTN|nr:alpha/beta fold hydrolase [Aeromicrobium ginsengisoli]KAA1399842.1 alpha/beta fold hydrolase [Aeromicrobium ginsengisoli]